MAAKCRYSTPGYTRRQVELVYQDAEVAGDRPIGYALQGGRVVHRTRRVVGVREDEQLWLCGSRRSTASRSSAEESLPASTGMGSTRAPQKRQHGLDEQVVRTGEHDQIALVD
jgi:hypothetical protein